MNCLPTIHIPPKPTPMNIAPNHINQAGIVTAPICNPLRTKITIAINQEIPTPRNSFLGPNLFKSLPIIIPKIMEKIIPPKITSSTFPLSASPPTIEITGTI